MKWLSFTLCVLVTVFFGCGNPTDSNPTERYIEIDVDDLPDTLVYFGEYEVSFSTNQPEVFRYIPRLVPVDREVAHDLPLARWNQNDTSAKFMLYNFEVDIADTVIGYTDTFSLFAGVVYQGHPGETFRERIESNGKEITYHNPFYVEEIYRDNLCFKSVIKIDEQFKDKYSKKTETVVVWRTPMNQGEYDDASKHMLDDTLTVLFEDLLDPTWHDERYHVEVHLFPHLSPDLVDDVRSKYDSFYYEERIGARNTLPIGYPLKN